MPKRKASFAFRNERPNKLKKTSSSVTVSDRLNSLTNRTSTAKKPIEILKWPSGNEHRTNEITENSVSPPLTMAGPSLPSSLRRASTLTLEDLNMAQNDDTNASSSSGLKSTTTEPSLFKIPSGLTKLALGSDSVAGASLHITKSDLIANVEETEVNTALDSLKSKVKKQPTNTNASKNSKPKSLAERPSIPFKIPSGLTKFALSTDTVAGSSLHIAKSDLITNVEETEMTCALDSLKSKVKKQLTYPKSQSIDSDKPLTDRNSGNKDKNVAKGSLRTGWSNEKIDSMVLYGSDYMQVVIAIDLTEKSIMPCFDEVCTRLQNLYSLLRVDILGIQIALMVFDGTSSGIRCLNFGASWPDLVEFLNTVHQLSVNRAEKACPVHEILKTIGEIFTWTPDSRRILIFINSIYSCQSATRDLISSCEALKNIEVKIYGVQIGNYYDAGKLNFMMSEITGGMNLCLMTYHRIVDTIHLICLRESNPDSLQAGRIGYMNNYAYRESTVWKRLRSQDEATPIRGLKRQGKANQNKKKKAATSSEKKRADTSSVKVKATTPSAKKSATTPSVKERATTQSAKIRDTAPSAKKRATTPSAKKRATTSSAKKMAAIYMYTPSAKTRTTSSSKKRAATSSAKKRAIAPSAKKGAITSSSKKRAATSSAKKKATAPYAKKGAITSSTKKRAATPSAKKRATALSAKKSVATPSAKKRAITSSAKKRAATPSAKKRAATTSVKELATTSSAKKRAAISSEKEMTVASSAKKKAVTSSMKKKAATLSVKKRATKSNVKKRASTLSANNSPTTSSAKKRAAPSSENMRATTLSENNFSVKKKVTASSEAKSSAKRKHTEKSTESTEQAQTLKGRAGKDKVQVRSKRTATLTEPKKAATLLEKKRFDTLSKKKRATTSSIKKRATTSSSVKRNATSLSGKKRAIALSEKKRTVASSTKEMANSSSKKQAATLFEKKRTTTSSAKKRSTTLSVKRKATTLPLKKRVIALSEKKRATTSSKKESVDKTTRKIRAKKVRK